MRPFWRLGGDEFVVLAVGQQDESMARELWQMPPASFKQAVDAGGQSCEVGGCVYCMKPMG
jgi:hypothetical protein